MCWRTFKKPVKLIAEEDIKVQKVLCKGNNGHLKSPCIGDIIWDDNVNVTLTSRLDSPKANYPEWSIHKGFHSVKEMKLVNTFLLQPNIWCSKEEMVLRYELGDVRCEFIIPKGATYYVNENDVCVSNKIIFTGNVLDK